MAKSFFHIDMLPALHGDCLWIEYGTKKQTYRILIDGGPLGTFESLSRCIDGMPAGNQVFELIVLTHVDADHIEGLVRLFADKPLPFAVHHVWFNGWRQMKKAHGLLGALQGEFLSALLARRVSHAWDPASAPWVVPNQGDLPECELSESGMKITLLSPHVKGLNKMARAWEKAMKKTGIRPGDLDAAWKLLAEKKKFLPKEGLLGAIPDLDELLKAQFPGDDAVPNESSIAFLAEFEGKSALFLGDAHPDVIYASLERLLAQRGIDHLACDAVKIAHHGSMHNTSEDMLRLIRSPRYLISTSGDYFKHPDPECIALILKYGKPERLYFNYKSNYNKQWLEEPCQKKYDYKAVVRKADDASLHLEL